MWPAIVQAIAAVAQVVTAVIIVVLTKRLVTATNTYAALTKKAVDLSTKQYEGDVSPMWHISVHPASTTDNEVWMKIHNLSRTSAILTYLLLRAESEAEDETRKFLINVGMPSTREHMFNAREFVLQTIQPYVVNGEWTGVIEIGIAFQLGTTSVSLASERFRFSIMVRNGAITSAKPKMASISVEPQRPTSGE